MSAARRQRRIAAIRDTACCAVLWVMAHSVAAEPVTDDMIRGAFQKAHSVMKTLRQSLHDILDGFLLSDPAAIVENADIVAQEMSRVRYEHPPEPGSPSEVEEWKAISEIVEHARLLQVAAHTSDFATAYLHYTVIANRCVACHQARREWGKLPTAQPTPASASPP